MTPAQLDSLAQSHRRAHDTKRTAPQAEVGSHSDLLALAAMRRV